MGNSLGGKRKKIKVMMVDGSTLKVKPPAQAVAILRDHPGNALLDAAEVKRIGLRARPLDSDAPLKPGKLYFLVEFPRLLPDQRGGARRAWSGALHVGARERLESLRFTRRTMSDLSSAVARMPSAVEAEETKDGIVRLKMRLPKAQVERLMKESKDAAEAAQKIMQLCAGNDGGTIPSPSPSAAVEPTPALARPERREKRTRFVTMPVEIIA